MSYIHHIDESEESDLIEIINNDPSYKIGDIIQIDFNNQMGERIYQITVDDSTGRKIVAIVEMNNVPNEFHVRNIDELVELLLYKGTSGDNILRQGDIVYLNDTLYTIDIDSHGYEIAVDENGNKINSEGNMYRGGINMRKNRRKNKTQKRKSSKRKSSKRKSTKRKHKSHKRK